METDWKRPKTVPSTTYHIETNEGTLHLTLGYEDDKLIEVRGMIGKAGTYANIITDTICKLISMYLQSPEPRYKIIKKFKKQFVDMKCGLESFIWEKNQYESSIDVIVKIVVKELDR